MARNRRKYGTKTRIAGDDAMNKGGGGQLPAVRPEGLLSDPKHLRADCNMIAQMIGCGVVAPDKAAELIQSAADLAKDAATRNRTREFKSAMSVLLAAAKLQQDRDRAPANAVQTNIGITVGGGAASLDDSEKILNQKRRIQLEREQFQLDRDRGDYFRRELVMQLCDLFGGMMRRVVEMAGAHSEELASDVQKYLESQEPAIGEVLGDL